jgi:hypothetical protein
VDDGSHGTVSQSEEGERMGREKRKERREEKKEMERKLSVM